MLCKGNNTLLLRGVLALLSDLALLSRISSDVLSLLSDLALFSRMSSGVLSLLSGLALLSTMRWYWPSPLTEIGIAWCA
jgi:hypothetical protein